MGAICKPKHAEQCYGIVVDQTYERSKKLNGSSELVPAGVPKLSSMCQSTDLQIHSVCRGVQPPPVEILNQRLDEFLRLAGTRRGQKVPSLLHLPCGSKIARCHGG